MEEETLQEPITVAAITCVQASSRKNSQESQSVDCDFLEAILKKQLEGDASPQVLPKEVTVYTQAPTTSTQITIYSHPQDNKRTTIKELQDVSYIIMSPTTPDKENLILGEESEIAMVNASQVLLAHEKKIQWDKTMKSSLTTIETEETDQDNDVTLCDDPGLESQGWDLMNEILSCQGNRRQWDPEGFEAYLMAEMIEERPKKTITNEDCIAVVYNYMPDDDLSMPDEEYYRWCEPLTDKDELYRRYSFRRRRIDYFNRPAVWFNNKWYPERYLPDPEDPEWFWTEGIELDRRLNPLIN